MFAPPANWQNNFQQGFREVSQRFQAGASQFQQSFQQGMYGAQSGFQNAANRASTAVRGYSTRFGGGMGAMGGSGLGGFTQMSSGNPQFGMGGMPQRNDAFAMQSSGMSNGGMGNGGMSNNGYQEKPYTPAQNNYSGESNGRCCTTKTIIGLLAILLIIAGSAGGAGFLLNLNEARKIATFGAANNGAGVNGTGAAGQAAIPNPALAFNIELQFLTSVTDAERLAFTQAAQKWQSVITKDTGSEAVLEKGSQFCGPGTQALTDTVIDDLLIFVVIAPIDGRGAILGSAAPCGFDDNDIIRLGIMEFDNADSAALVASGQFSDVVLHEMGHVLGLGTSWDRLGLITKLTANNPNGPFKYFGTAGNVGNQEVGGGSQADVENLGGPGTARGHWKDSIYQNELMTGFISSGRNPLSKLTVRALADLGYVVDPAQADDYRVPAPGRRLKADANRQAYGNDVKKITMHELKTRKKGSKRSFKLKYPQLGRRKVDMH